MLNVSIAIVLLSVESDTIFCVCLSSDVIAEFICSIPSLCSLEAYSICLIKSIV